MPLAKLHVLEGQYDEARLGKVSSAVQNGLISALGIPPEGFVHIIHILPKSQFRHTDHSWTQRQRSAANPEARCRRGSEIRRAQTLKRLNLF